jgi:hypothetical protein
MTRYKYLCTQRPPGPGAIPGGAKEVEDYGDKINGAWGHAIYEHKLTDRQIDDYELKPADQEE